MTGFPPDSERRKGPPPPPPILHPIGRSASTARAPVDPIGCLLRSKGLFTVVTSALAAIVAPTALSLWRQPLADQGVTIPALLVPFLDRPWIIVALCGPAFLCGILLMATPRWRWWNLAISTLFLTLVLVIVFLVAWVGLRALYAGALNA